VVRRPRAGQGDEAPVGSTVGRGRAGSKKETRAMFKDACNSARGFTPRPSFRTEPLRNEEEWAVTAWHILGRIQKLMRQQERDGSLQLQVVQEHSICLGL
jgi:hypothetical protein